jgi:hypothetical protein
VLLFLRQLVEMPTALARSTPAAFDEARYNLAVSILVVGRGRIYGSNGT